METNITGDNNMVGPSNRQFIKTTNNIYTINVDINVNGSTSRVHQHREELSISGGHIHHVIDFLQKIAGPSGHAAQIATRPEAASLSQREPASKEQDEVVRERKGEESMIHQKHKALGHISSIQTWFQTAIKSLMDPQRKPAFTDSVRILDTDGQVLKPGDAVFNFLRSWGHSLFVGDGYVVRYDRSSNTVVKKKLDMTSPFYKDNLYCFDQLNVFPPEERVQRALQYVGRPCPVPGVSADFLFWTFTGLSYVQSYQRGFDLTPWTLQFLTGY